MRFIREAWSRMKKETIVASNLLGLDGLVLLGLSATTLLISTALPVAAQTAGWQPGPGAILDNTYEGEIDIPTSGAAVRASSPVLVAGWFVDTTAQGWAGADAAQVWLGTMEDPQGRALANALVA